MSAQAPQRLIELDSLRGIAALVVVLHHAWLSLSEQPSWLVWLFSDTPLRPIGMGRQAVIFFFVLSGYVLTLALLRQERKRPGSVLTVSGWAQYGLQRAIRLGIPVLAVVLFSAALQSMFWSGPLPDGTPHILAGAIWSDMWTWSDVVSQALLLRSGDGFQLNPVLWSLVHEWRIALLLPLVLLFRGRVALLLATALLGAAIARLAGMPEGQVALGQSLPGSLAASAGFLPAFAAGAALALRPGVKLDQTQAVAAGTAILVMVMAAHDYGVIAASALLILLAERGGPLARTLRQAGLLWLGKISFSLYLIHMPLMLALAHAFRGMLPDWAIAGLAIPLSLPLAFALHMLVEQPAHRLARRVPQPRRQASRRGAMEQA
ncbi:acyltransferase family protein [Pseudoroseomonas globiformis]|uniref:Acyltransferase family protein n=1 Tax=Teichococcus globiformis TaxID=2307229 RepID=A0ABV7FX14_9PROT